MANKTQSITGAFQRANARNEPGAPAYALSAEAALAQYAATGCLYGAFYASAGEQLDVVLELCQELDAEYLAKVAVYCRETGYMKDMPALLCAVLSVRGPELLAAVSPAGFTILAKP